MTAGRVIGGAIVALSVVLAWWVTRGGTVSREEALAIVDARIAELEARIGPWPGPRAIGAELLTRHR